MTKRLQDDLYSQGASWQEQLPTVFTALDGSLLQPGKDFVSGSMHVIIARDTTLKNGGAAVKPSFEVLLPDFAKKRQSEIEAQLTEMGWDAQSAPQRFKNQQHLFLVVSQSPFDTSCQQKCRQAGLDAAAALNGSWSGDVSLLVNQTLHGDDFVYGYLQGLYQPKSFVSKVDVKLPPKLYWCQDQPPSKEQVERIKVLSQATVLCRWLQDAPANWMNPTRLAEVAAWVGKEGGAQVSTLSNEEMKELGMGAFLAVAKGSDLPAYLVSIEIKGRNPNAKKVALVGKGLTFDTGGVSIKPAASMDEMKYDMSGAATVIGAAFALSRLQPDHNVVCAMGAVENMCSGKATRPGDIVKTYKGKTVEILNTDAEGRLVLADVIAYTIEKHKPAFLINTATLTGAVIYGLGHMGAAYMSNSEAMAQHIENSARLQSEPIWRLPLWPETTKEVKSDFADLANLPKPNVRAGTIMGGAFLKEFVGDTPWAHMDIAGTAWSCQATGFPRSGGSGYGVLTLVQSCLAYEGQALKETSDA